MTIINTSYPVFEADQVLSQNDLNRLISYLEEQDHHSRVQLLGMGLVCGLNISKPKPAELHVSCGTGITSLGYLVPFEGAKFTHFKTINLSDSFLNPDVNQHAYLENLYQYTSLYEAFETSLELLEADAEDEDKQPLTQSLLDNKVVMLLVETLLIDQKNCVALDCDDKGKRLEFKVRPLLIDLETLLESGIELSANNYVNFEVLALPRLNVPKKHLAKVSDILEAYEHVIDKTITSINDTFEPLHNHYTDAFGELDNYNRLLDVSSRIKSVYNEQKNEIYLQYIWDWVGDIVDTYNEIVEFHSNYPSLCCPDKAKFPFHILLGSTDQATEEVLYDNEYLKYRTPFIKTGVLSEEEKPLKAQLKSLLEKLISQIGSFNLNLEKVIDEGIKITPSFTGETPLSKKAIPFYYAEIKELNKKWSPELTLKNRNKNILSYHSSQYNSSSQRVISPLEYDIKAYDFFRIEGHIGEDYNKAITEVTSLQEKYRLPFKVVGINAVDDTGRTVLFSNDGQTWDDLEVEYDLAKTKLINTVEFIVDWLNKNRSSVQEVYPAFNENFFTSLENTTTEFKTLLTDDFTDFLENYQTFYDALEKLNDLFLLHNACIDLIQKNNESAVLQEIENRLEDFNNIILEDAFTIIYQEAIDRWIRGVKSTFLSEFSKKHPALEHQAGVIKGGTFVMVYSDYSIFQQKSSPVFTAPIFFDFAKDHVAKFEFSDTEVKQITNKNVLRKRKIHLATIKNKNSKTENACSKEVLQAIKDHKANISNYVSSTLNPAVASYIAEVLSPVPAYEPDEPQDDNAIQKKIVADFYLPYICCSDGDSINIVLSPGTQKPVLADFDGEDFDEDDFYTDEQ